MKKRDIYIIVLAYNEQKNIRSFLTKLKKYTSNIIVVNDGSTDKTPKILQEFSKLVIVNLKKNRGKSYAMKVGAKKAWALKAGGIIFMDGDNQHNPIHIPAFIDYLQKGQDIIIGVRILKSGVPIARKIGNNLCILLIKLMFNLSIPDVLCGYRGFSKTGFKQILWTSNGYDVELEVVTLIGRKKLNYILHKVETIYLEKYKGMSVSKGMRIIMKLPYWKVRKI